MRFGLSQRTKRKLINKITYNYLLRLLLLNFWFRIAFFSIVLVGILSLLFLSKIWKVSPNTFLPVIRVSGLEWVQAWLQKRTARAEMALGHYELAHYAWWGAVANNPSDREGLRGFLTNLVLNPSTTQELVGTGLDQAAWLLRLTRTNSIDLDLVIVFLEKHAYHERVTTLLEPLVSHLTSRQQAAYLKALFHQNRIVEFNVRWRQFEASHSQDPELALYRAAATAGWGSEHDSIQSKQILAAALDEPRSRLRAARLQLAVSLHTGELAPAERAFTLLKDVRQDALAEHAVYWQILAKNGHGEAAKKLARAFIDPPKSDRDLIRLTDAYLALGMEEETGQCFQTLAAQFPDADDVWLRYSDFLGKVGRWDDLRLLGIKLRAAQRHNDSLGGYSYFLEGWAESAQQRPMPAEGAFQKMVQLWVGEPKFAIATAVRLLKLGYPGPARQLLEKIENEAEPEPSYWRAAFEVAAEQKDAALLLKAGRKQFELGPEDLSAGNHYATALLVNRQQPEAILKLTLPLINTHPDSIAAQLNQAAALARSQQAPAALLLLSRIDTNSLTRAEICLYQLAEFDAAFEGKNFDDAWRWLEQIEAKTLYPADQAWLQECERRLPPRGQANL